jgi:GNAT superfamily N-acetyltransferase
MTVTAAPALAIVPYRPDHAAAWRDLNIAWLTRWFWVEPKDEAVLGDPQTHVLGKGGVILIAERAGVAVGCCALLPMGEGRWELTKMAVAEAMRGQGIGVLLMTAVIDQARRLGAERLFLESNTVLEPAIALYRRFGFQEVAVCGSMYQRCNIAMERPL